MSRLHSVAVFASLAIAFALTANVAAAGPVLYADPFHQSPVRGDPGDLLLLAGAGLVAGSHVMYRRIDDTICRPAPMDVSALSGDQEGEAPIVSETALPDNVVVQLPAAMARGVAYELWIETPEGQWSNPVRINDARPLWLTPAVVPMSGSVATLARELKVVGRNLDHAPGAVTTVRLIGPGGSYLLPAADDGNAATSIERYAAVAALPPFLNPGSYRVQVARDGVSFVEVQGQQLLVVDDAPPPASVVRISDYGCRPDDGVDDRACFEQAFLDLSLRGGLALLPRGTWELLDPPPGVNGLVLPRGVEMRGEGPLTTHVVRGPTWTATVVFTVLGQSRVSGIHFDDRYEQRDERAVHFQLGKRPSTTGPGEPHVIEDITFTGNAFERMHNAIGGGGLPVRRLYIVGNQFRAYKDALMLDAYYLPFEPHQQFALEDAIIRQNLFLPGDYYAPEINQGAIATQVGATRRVDFSQNVADGRASGTADSSVPSGWRAAFFFHSTNNHEELLVSENLMSCTGDKVGDGEAIAFDEARNTYAFDGPMRVGSAAADRVTVSGRLLDPWPGVFTGHWLQIVNGTGVGQSRRIVGYAPITPGTWEFRVAPPFDVIPTSDSSFVVTRQFWQTYLVDNEVDIRGCTKRNATFKKSGQFTIWAQTSDSAIDGNAHYESDGIWLFAGHSATYSSLPPSLPPAVPRRVHFMHFLEIWNNRVYDEFDYATSHWSYGGSFSGIQLLYWTLANQVPAQSGYGISIAHNTVAHADGYAGGGIAIFRAWFAESSPPTTPVQYRSVLIHNNQVRNIMCVTPGCLSDPVRRIGIHIQDAHAHDTVLAANDIYKCHEPIVDNGTETTIVGGFSGSK